MWKISVFVNLNCMDIFLSDIGH